MPHETLTQQRKIHKVMGEYKSGLLKSGHGGRKVSIRRQAVAIAMSEAGVSRRPARRRK